MDPSPLGLYASSSRESSPDESIHALHLYNMATLAIYWVTLCAYYIVEARRQTCTKVVQRECTAGDVLLSWCPSKFHAADALATCVEFYARRLDFRPLFPARHARPAVPASPIEGTSRPILSAGLGQTWRVLINSAMIRRAYWACLMPAPRKDVKRSCSFILSSFFSESLNA
jgi:hypothetical protein